MVIEKLKYNDNLTESEKQIANYLLDEENHIDYITSTDLAKATFTSQTTVVRLYQKIGFKSYRKFMSVLAMEKKEYEQADFDLNNFNDNFTNYDNIKNLLTKLYQNSINDISSATDKNTMIRVCNRIINTQVIDIYFTCPPSAESIVLYLQRRLTNVGKHCTLQNSLDDYYYEKIKDSKNHMAILLNMGDYDELMIDIATKLKDTNMYTVSISDKNKSKLRQLTQDNLFIENKTNTTLLDEVSIFMSYQYIIYLILILVYAKTDNVLIKY